MVNLEHKLTVDDLIVEYMIYKVRNGYEPSFTTSEFISFLYFFESKMSVEDTLYENEKLFKRFFDRKGASDWCITSNYFKGEKEIVPHMDMAYNKEDKDYLIKANYKLSGYDISVINTYFMDNGMGKYEDFKGTTSKIRKIIGEYLSNQTKRQFDETIEPNSNDLIVGKHVAAVIIANIWESHINELIKNNEWPKQCTDINKYLFNMDLAKIIGLKSIKNKLIEVYNTFSKRIAILYHQDKNLKISTNSNIYLSRANYDLLIKGYEKIMNTTFGQYKKSFDIDLSTLTFKESHELSIVYDWSDEVDTKTTINKINNNTAKKIVKELNKTNKPKI